MRSRCLNLSGPLTKPSTFAYKPQSTPRTFTTSSALYKNPLARRKGGDLGSHLPKYVIPQDVEIPEYPYGANLLFKQSNKGLYGGKRIQFGNNVSRKTETKTRRYWKPNVLSKALYSEAFQKRIKLRITANVLKTVDREGGLDRYLLKQSENRIKELGPLGWQLRWTLLQRPSVIRRMREDAAALGVPEEEVDRQWPVPQEVPAKALQQAVNPEEEELIINQQRTAQLREERAEKELRRTRLKIEAEAGREYSDAHHVAKRYLQRGTIETLDQGIKLALLREPQRAYSRERNLVSYKARLAAKLGKEKFESEQQFQEAVKADRRNIKEDIATAGSYEEYRKKVNPVAAAKNATKLEAAGGEGAIKAQKRVAHAKEILDAESAVSDENTPEEERLRIENALDRARRMIEAGSKSAYVQEALAKWEDAHADEWPLDSVSKDAGIGEMWEEAEHFEEGWDALAQATENENADKQPRV